MALNDPGPFSRREFLQTGPSNRLGASQLGTPTSASAFRSAPDLNPIANRLANNPEALDRYIARRDANREGADNPTTNSMHPHNLWSDGYARPNRFRVTFGSSISQFFYKDAGFIEDRKIKNKHEPNSLDVEAFNFPSRSVMTHDYSTYGPMIKIPYSVLYNDITMTIRITEDHWDKDMIAQWMHFGLIDENYDARFAFDAVSDIIIEQLDLQGGTGASTTLHNAFPTLMTEIPIDMNGTDQIEKLNVTFNFSHWSHL
jgi:hypothetical protein